MKAESIYYYQNKNYFKGKGVLITGATGGIGSLLMKTLVDLGARVVVLVKDEKKLKETLISKKIIQI
jgi:FlaA1/EpsC-like NDP-sugar epimerase